MILYVAGPMSSLPDFNYPEFNRVAAVLRDAGFTVLNPAENQAPPCGSWEGWMRIAIAQVIQAQGLALLSGWEQSRGASLEVSIAAALQLPCRPWSEYVDAAQ